MASIRPDRPNLLFLMADQMQAAVLDEGNPCLTPNFAALQARGIRFTRAHTPNAVCSPARASLMTGLLPHNHNVWTVTHTVRPDRAVLRPSRHWAEELRQAGYRTGYFGKWHVERSEELDRFGWETAATAASPQVVEAVGRAGRRMSEGCWHHEGWLTSRPGYAPHRFCGMTEVPPEERGLGIHVSNAASYLTNVTAGQDPWACFVSVLEPHDPFYTGREAFDRYNGLDVPVSPTLRDDLRGRPEIYARARVPWRDWSEEDHRNAAVCYYASVTEIDTLFGQLLDQLEAAGQTDNTIVVLTSDHGEALGAHGLYCKNYSAGEEIYRVPLVLAGPGITSGRESDALVGLQDMHATLLDLLGLDSRESPDGASFADLCRSDNEQLTDDRRGYAEYEGNRFQLTQRILWDGDWKYVFNGFARDEMYNLADDPHEERNLLAGDYGVQAEADRLLSLIWGRIRETGDLTLLNSQYPVLQIGSVGPEAAL